MLFKLLGGAVCLIILVAALNLGKAANHDQNTSNRVAGLWSQVYIGESESDVRSVLGKPDDTSTFTTSNFSGGTDKMDTWMYGTLSSNTYSLDFTNGKVTDKSKM
jgi:hypothetical protein